MQLTVTGYSPDGPRFKHLFGRYVEGFKPWTHCDKCFIAKHAKGIVPGIEDGVYPLDDHLFYLCGVAGPDPKSLRPQDARRRTNVHLAVRPRKGSVAAIGSVYGATFIITDAEAIAIRPPSAELMQAVHDLELAEKHWRCKNFQFCWQHFNASAHDIRAQNEVRTERPPDA